MIQRNSRWLALVPFGVGQFQNGQTALGWTFLDEPSRCSSSGSVVSQVVTIYNENQMNDAIRSGSATASGYHARAEDAYVATQPLHGRDSRSWPSPGSSTREATFVPEHVEVRPRPLPPLSLAPSCCRSSAAARPGRGAILGVGGRF